MIRACILFSLMSILSCSQNKIPVPNSETGTLEVLHKLPKILKESSGIALSEDQKNYWIIQDHGNTNTVYGLNFNAKIISEIDVKNTVNNDWEDITQDRNGFTYIGDFGNNDNERQNLAIYKVKLNSSQTETEVLQTTTFFYPEQTKFPPKKSDLLYDCEAFVVYDNNFYLFTKNRSKNFDGTFLVYKVLNKNGEGDAKLVGKLKIDGNFSEAAITSATINSKEDKIILLAHKNLYILSGFSPEDFTKTLIKKISLNHDSQKEALTFKDEKTLIIADERKDKDFGNLYQFKLE
ncbi:hypothetical protein [Kaistella jeonii]|uniref:SdiA-regulated family protein n=1 Tax=Kaistella jeonii TaxID=266749 RepID=A0A0C1D333_9FLAO|nr:hypothetical protein [Kaistella jeonii]KIA88200.1 hypothetical protein OA86_11805 [Kaistella jeonii]SFC25690.1 hypothetical protein SAMN05421876_11117 [Kaistella jeonii]VEI95663.1 Uncharacterised protein [Kaistella jeonii]